MELSINFLNVEPPLIFRFGLPVGENIIQFRGDPVCGWKISQCPVDRTVKRRERLIPGADLDTCTAARSVPVINAHTRTLSNIDRPFFIAVVDYFVTVTNRLCRTFPGTFAALSAKIL